MRTATVLLVLALAACGRGVDAEPSVLTLLPPVFRGGTANAAALCLEPGAEARTDLWVHRRSVTFTVRGRSRGAGEVEANLGGDGGRTATGPGDAPLELTVRVAPAAGAHTLVVRRSHGATGPFCLEQVAVAQ